MPKSQGGIGIKDLITWNKPTIAKLTWAVDKKKEVLFKWVHERYIKHRTWWNYAPPHEFSWYWKKTCRVKDEFKKGCRNPLDWDWEGEPEYRVAKGRRMKTTYSILAVMHRQYRLRQWWNQIPIIQNSNQMLRYLKQSKGLGTMKQSARNHRIFKKQQITTCQTAYLIKDQVRSRILFLNTCSKTFSSYVDSLLNYDTRDTQILGCT
ncbi:LOW QUALITY PROTEIN: hypothetical protein Cgig2_032284 [Carnegiea gigantea]|uniref:Uncharacterized protein n=1 Tax=Carnegiea gigantea TaxID=171969 RepID=A0A9Q1GK09_9CARY|nr:LOW QUALITY PROTEIN: hypothetical protein Cgig2_032284 [Carnegiea gigantea]